MPLIAIDTSQGACSVALADGSTILDSLTEPDRNKQAEQLVPLINQLLEANKLTYADLTGIAVAIGPGGFTALRIGIAAAKGITLACPNAATYGASLFDALIHRDDTPKDCIIAHDARRNQLYVQPFHNGKALAEPSMIESDDLDTYAVNHQLPVIHTDDIPPLSAVDVAIAAANTASSPLTPLYIRPPDAKLPQTSAS